MRGIINKSILKGIQRGAKMKTIKRYLSIYFNIKIGHKAFVSRYGQIKRRVSQTL
jgi:methionine salvage enolase-phosphatase E1